MGEFPSGAVTFVFTDIEGSTRLVQAAAGALRARCSPSTSGWCARPSPGTAATRSTRRATRSSTRSEAHTKPCSPRSRRSGRSRATPGRTRPNVKVRMGIHTGQAAPVERPLHGSRGAPRGAHLRGRPRRPDPGLAGDAEPARGRGGRPRRRPPRPGRPAAQRHRPPRPPVSGRRLRTGDRVSRRSRRGRRLADEPQTPIWRRRTAIVASRVIALLAAVAVAVFLDDAWDDDRARGVFARTTSASSTRGRDRIVAGIPVGIRPGPLAVGGGAVWVGNLDERTLTKIDSGVAHPAGTFPLDNRTPTGIAVGAGSVWVAHGALGQLVCSRSGVRTR